MTPGEVNTLLTVTPSVIGGGAERAAMALHEEFTSRGLESWVAAGNVNGESPNVVRIPNDAEWQPVSRKLMQSASALEARGWNPLAPKSLRALARPRRTLRRLQGYEDFDFPASRNILDLTPRRPDVLHLHNLHGGYFDVRCLPELSRAVPTVYTLHDTWALTGHCANPLECTRWTVGCGECPHLDVYVDIPRDQSAANFRMKRQSLVSSVAHLAVPSRWLLNMVERAGLLASGLDARVVPNGIDTDVFSPGRREEERRKLGIADDKLVLAFSGRSANHNPFKDFDTLVRAIDRVVALGSVQPLLLVIGGQVPKADSWGFETRTIPFLTSPDRVAATLAVADIYIHSSKAETFGLAVAEAMACGLPVIASRVGGIPEVVEEGTTGLLCEAGDSLDFARAIELLSSNLGLRAAMGAAGALRARQLFTLSRQADSYLDLYDELAAERLGRSSS